MTIDNTSVQASGDRDVVIPRITWLVAAGVACVDVSEVHDRGVCRQEGVSQFAKPVLRHVAHWVVTVKCAVRAAYHDQSHVLCSRS